MPPDIGMRLAVASERNLRRALLMAESGRFTFAPATSYPLDHVPRLPDWEVYIGRLAREILQEQSPSKLLQARDMLYELLTNCIPAGQILQTLCRDLFKALDDSLKHDVAHWAAFYEHRLSQGSKEIFHLEAFVAKFMAMYKTWLSMLFG